MEPFGLPVGLRRGMVLGGLAGMGLLESQGRDRASPRPPRAVGGALSE